MEDQTPELFDTELESSNQDFIVEKIIKYSFLKVVRHLNRIQTKKLSSN